MGGLPCLHCFEGFIKKGLHSWLAKSHDLRPIMFWQRTKLLWSVYHIFCPCFGHRRGTISQWPPDSGHLEIEPFEDVEERRRTIHEPAGGGRHTTGCSTQTPVSCDWLKQSAKYSPCIEVVWESGRKFLWGAFSRTKGPNFTPRDRRSMAGDVVPPCRCWLVQGVHSVRITLKDNKELVTNSPKADPKV